MKIELLKLGWVRVSVEDGKGIVEIDKDNNGEPSISLEIDLAESVKEIKG